ncbi:hypothetical protein PMM47T1_08151 [Pseudomonas sp. M47T1]|uniref:hypothetical protein n=1 Tax=Pseudomonas sp. M47T1 TaxID=1179778 RepID=UPI0002607567|nr:hypothetical protein [Pseudomonas sp. M47T1]EIK97098.1 hypothetical protein PMM47T1_08151 [Pseudomonas sp. M47T1]
MRIIEKNGALVRTLTPAEQVLVEGFVHNSLDGHRLLQANQWLMKVRGQGQWLACDCQANALPVMNVTLNSSTGTLFLKNNPGTAEHAADCPFIKDDREPGSASERDEPPAAWLAPDVPLRLIGEFRPADPSDSGVDSAANTRKEQHRLLSLLVTLIEASGLNVYATQHKQDLTRQFAELRRVAARYPLVERVPASNYLETRMDMKHMMMLKARLKDSTAFGSQRRYGLLLDCVNEVRTRKVFNGRSDTGFDFQGHHWLWGGERTAGPLLALALYSPTTAGSQYYEMIHVASVPVLSRAQLFPVLREEEREPLMVSLIDWMAGKGVNVIMRRPVIGGDVMDELVLTSDLDRVLSVSLMKQPLGPEPSSDTFKRLADFKSLDTFRKYVAGFFMRERD